MQYETYKHVKYDLYENSKIRGLASIDVDINKCLVLFGINAEFNIKNVKTTVTKEFASKYKTHVTTQKL